MKYVVIVGDGMADYPIPELGARTPLEVANTPNLDHLAREGRMGMIKTIPEGMEPDSTVANLSILGYDPRHYYTGRGPFEAGAAGVELGEHDVAFRCNLVTVKNSRMVDYSAGHISNEEATELLKEVGRLGIGELFSGVSYRHIFVLRNSDIRVGCTPPHDIVGEPIQQHMIPAEGGKTAEKLNELMLHSLELLAKHPVNLRREQEGKNPGNMIWLWGPGPRPNLEPFHQRYGLRGAVISSVNLIKGIGVYAGMEIVEVPGATGYYDTNYEEIVDHALETLKTNDFVYVHVEAIDEAGHEGNAERKIQVLEDFDRRLVGRLINRAENCRIAALPDHPTPISVRVHVSDPVPFVIFSPGKRGDGLTFDEKSGGEGSLGFLEGPEFMRLFLESS
jgi:2,3-bisphosphoglycerate-independent phosphoglycerate mutase